MTTPILTKKQMRMQKPQVVSRKTPNVFVSHTQKDEKFCDMFDRVCSRVGIKAFRSEFEEIQYPAWKTIKKEINKSSAIFLLVGKELVKNQELRDYDWRFTQNWISYEIGIACQKEIDVWAICDDVTINFPMPYINNYLTVSLAHKDSFNYLRDVLKQYKEGYIFPVPCLDVNHKNLSVKCPHKDCEAEFNLHETLSLIHI